MNEAQEARAEAESLSPSRKRDELFKQGSETRNESPSQRVADLARAATARIKGEKRSIATATRSSSGRCRPSLTPSYRGDLQSLWARAAPGSSHLKFAPGGNAL